MAENHACIKESEWIDTKKRIGRLEDNEREDYGSRKELSLAIKNLGETLVKVNENLDSLNKKNESTNAKVDDLKKEVNKKIDDLEDQINNQKIDDMKQGFELEIKDVKNNSLNLKPIKEKVLYVLIGLGVVYILLDKTGVLLKLFKLN